MTDKTPKASPTTSADDHEHTRTGTSPAAIKAAFLDNLNYVVGRPLDISTAEDRYQAVAHSVRDRFMQQWVKQVERWNSPDLRQVSYLSAEFLVGPRLGKDLLNLGISENMRQAMAELDLNLEEFVGLEKDPGLGSKPGILPGSLSLTPIIPCCRKLWKNGLLLYSPQSCPDIWRSSTRSIAAFSTKSASGSRVMREKSRICRSCGLPARS